jgi:hypothetical protein
MLFQVYFKNSLGPAEWDCLPEYCRSLPPLCNGIDNNAMIHAGVVDSVFAHTSPQPLPDPDRFHVPFALPANFSSQWNQINLCTRSYAIAGVIVQGEHPFWQGEYQEACQQVSANYVYLSCDSYTVRYNLRNAY